MIDDVQADLFREHFIVVLMGLLPHVGFLLLPKLPLRRFLKPHEEPYVLLDLFINVYFRLAVNYLASRAGLFLREHEVEEAKRPLGQTYMKPLFLNLRGFRRIV